MTADYTSKDVSVLDAISHIRLNPAMYIGETSNPVHLVEEALDNALDECLGGFATVVAVVIDTKLKKYSVIDNGRGIPIDKDVPLLISREIFSGAKFQDRKSAYKIASGLHGVGLTAVNALSSKYTIEIYRDKQHAKFEFANAKYKKKIIEPFTEERPFSSKIEFIPDSTIFENMDADITRIKKRLLMASVELPNVIFVINIDGVKEFIKIDKEEFFKTYCLNGDTDLSDIIDVSSSDGAESFNVRFCFSFSGSMTPRIATSVNLLPVESGGTHVSCFYDILKDVFTTKSKKLDIKVQPSDMLCGLRAYFSLSLIKPDLSGQTKDKLVNRKAYIEKLGKKIRAGIDQYYDSNPDKLTEVLTFFHNYRAKIDSKKLNHSGSGKRGSTKFTKLRDCVSNGGELFIVEGDSAGGSFIECRDPYKHAVFPLKGKISSIASKKDIKEHKEIAELIQALGTGVVPHFDISKLRYDKVICSVDADEDGKHIFCLLTMALAKLVPDIIRNGHYYLSITPLYAVTKKGIFRPLWTDDDLKEARKKNEPITRYKGLGELSPWKLKICALDEATRKLIRVNYTKSYDDLFKLFSSSEARRDLLDGKYTIGG